MLLYYYYTYICCLSSKDSFLFFPWRFCLCASNWERRLVISAWKHVSICYKVPYTKEMSKIAKFITHLSQSGKTYPGTHNIVIWAKLYMYNMYKQMSMTINNHFWKSKFFVNIDQFSFSDLLFNYASINPSYRPYPPTPGPHTNTLQTKNMTPSYCHIIIYINYEFSFQVISPETFTKRLWE